jgi:hypothetical protein
MINANQLHRSRVGLRMLAELPPNCKCTVLARESWNSPAHATIFSSISAGHVLAIVRLAGQNDGRIAISARDNKSQFECLDLEHVEPAADMSSLAMVSAD